MEISENLMVPRTMDKWALFMGRNGGYRDAGLMEFRRDWREHRSIRICWEKEKYPGAPRWVVGLLYDAKVTDMGMI